MPSRYSHLSPFLIGTFSLALLGMSGCSEQIDKHYSTLQDAAVLKDKGWLPDWLPKDAEDIKLQYDLDSNQLFIRLQTQLAHEWFPPHCYRSEFIDQLPQTLPSWWPVNAKQYSQMKRNYRVYLCKDQGLWWIAEPEHSPFVLIWQ
ncbi:hypothetical protein [Pseudoalteromonas xiamenensis]